MITQILISPIWQTIGVVIAIATAIAVIIAFISNKHRNAREKGIVSAIVLIGTAIVIVASGFGINAVTPSDQRTPPLTVTPILTATEVPAHSQPPTVSPTNTPSTSISNDYAAAQPGNTCDTGGGTWTAQGLNPFSCGQWINPVSTGIWGYLTLQLPNNTAFSANNKVTVTGGNFDARWVACIGLAEMGASTGYLAAYCGNGTWSIYTITNNGTIIQPLKNNIVTTFRTSTTISLTLNRNTLLFTIDAEKYQVSVSPIQPIKIALGFEKNPGCDTCSVLPTNFSYIIPAS